LAIDDVLRAEDARTMLAPLLPVVLSWTVFDLRLEPSGPVLVSLALFALLNMPVPHEHRKSSRDHH
jgi:hypothetical protein